MADFLRAGELDRRITIQVETLAVNDFKEREKTWSTFASNLPAKREYISGSEPMGEFERRAERSVRFKIRWLSGISAKMRIIDDDSNTWEITAIEEIGRRIGLYLYVVGWPERQG